jgi:phytoene dehydrogenase-like protein
LTTYYYDAVVLGMEFGPLAAGALLAKRGFRVLVIGQNAPTDHYPCYGYDFVRRPFLLTAAGSPVLTRMVKELGIGQLLQHATYVPDPAWQVVLPNARINVGRDLKRVVKEMRREIPGTADNIDDAFEALGRINGEIHKFFDNDFVLPPETFFEKREYSRVEVQNPFRLPFFLQSTKHAADVPEVLLLPALWELGRERQLHPLVHYRQLGSWLFDCVAFYKGRDGLRKLLVDQVSGQGGDIHLRRQATDIIVKRGAVIGVRLAGHDEITGCQMVLTHLTPKELSPLIAPGSWTKRFKQLIQASPLPEAVGYAVNLGVRAEVIPEGMGKTVFLAAGKESGADLLLRAENVPQHDTRRAVLNVSCAIPIEEADKIASGEVRDNILDRMREIVPFLDQYLEVIHSPFDGFGPLALAGSHKGEAPQVPHPEEVPTWHMRRPPENALLGTAALPHRTGIKGLLLSGDQMVSGLGTEGELLAAWGATRIACKMDPRRERLVKSMRSKVEM